MNIKKGQAPKHPALNNTPAILAHLTKAERFLFLLVQNGKASTKEILSQCKSTNAANYALEYRRKGLSILTVKNVDLRTGEKYGVYLLEATSKQLASELLEIALAKAQAKLEASPKLKAAVKTAYKPASS